MIRVKAFERILSRGVAFAVRRSAKNHSDVFRLRGQSTSILSYSTRSVVGSGVVALGPDIGCGRTDRRRDYRVSVAPSPSSSANGPLVLDTRLDPNGKVLRVRFNHGEERLYPYSWLRDCCRCSACFHQRTRARLVQFHEINLNDMPTDVEANVESQELTVTWSDDHRGVFGYQWLLEHNFGTAGQERPTRSTATSQLLWNSDLQNNFLTFDFQKLLKDDHILYNWLMALKETGLVLISNAPQVEGQLEKIANRIAFARMTCFGPAMFVRNKDYQGRVAYTTSKLELHNDLVYYDYVPGVKMVHCIQEQASGVKGRSLFVDGFMAANQFRQQFHDQFRLLTSVKLDFCGIGKDYLDYHLLSRHSTIKLNEAENIVQIVYNSKARDSCLNLSTDEVDQFYRALKNFAEILHSPKNMVEINLRAGDVVCLDNWRVLHGRTPFEVIPGSEAIVQRAYMDWDDVHSKRRVLKSELGIPDDKQ